ncbi:hypothetical protein EJB05_13910, partial [Eragrostis curvula]
MEQIGGELAAKRPNLSFSGADAGEDRLSALPDDILVLILLRLDTISEAARTCVLSLPWRRIWTLLPEITFCIDPDYHHIREVLSVSEAPVLHSIFVVTKCDTPDFVAAWLPLAARRLSGYLVYENLVEGHEEEVDRAIPLPCFGNATEIDLELGFLALSLPSSGVFTGLTELCLKSVRFLGPCDLDDVVSSPRCPGLRRLRVRKTRGLHVLAIQSKSLLKIDLGYLNGLQKLSIDASALKKLTLLFSFRHHQPVADISAPQLVFFRWRGAYDPSSVQLGNLGQLQRLSTYFIRVYGQQVSIYNRAILQLLHRFQVIHNLNIMLGYPQDIGELQYLMEDITRLPRVTFLELAHECPSGCPCDEQTNWKIDVLLLNRLEEVEVTNLKGAEYEVTFVKQLFSWATVLRKMRITFANLVSESMASELRERLLTFSRPEDA